MKLFSSLIFSTTILYCNLQAMNNEKTSLPTKPIENCTIDFIVYIVPHISDLAIRNNIKAQIKENHEPLISGSKYVVSNRPCEKAYLDLISFWKSDVVSALKSDISFTIYDSKKGKESGFSDFEYLTNIYGILKKCCPSCKDQIK